MPPLHFDNRFLRELPGDPDTAPGARQVEGALYTRVRATPVAAPRVIAWSTEVAAALGLDLDDRCDPRLPQVFAGNAQVDGMAPWASNYGGHQFGQWAGQLGDGRAISLGEVVGARGARWELQLKGAGPTPYSRGADGRAVLRSSVREFLCSEAMHHLGVPTTRALCLAATGEQVVRDMFYDGRPRSEPGAIVCRVAPSFIRFGSFELPASRGDVDLLRKLADFTIARDFPHLAGTGSTLYADWFGEVCERTAWMIAHWMRVGFVHGVMNTDNMSILGLTLDYGPYGWIDAFDPDFTPNTTDAQQRRYRYGQQPAVAWWNLSRLAGALSPLFDDIAPLQAGLDRYRAAYLQADRERVAAKLGLRAADDDDVALMGSLEAVMTAASMDMTLTFRVLTDGAPDVLTTQSFEAATYAPGGLLGQREALDAWLARYRARLAQDAWPEPRRLARMRAANPVYVLRNYLAQQAIERAEQGDESGIHELLDLVRRPYDAQAGRERFAARRPEWARDREGCSMLSCSS